MPRDARDDIRFCLAAGVNARSFERSPLSGEELFTRGEADPVVMPEWGEGEGKYGDLLAFLHGFGMGNSNDVAGARFDITADDRVSIQNTTLNDYTLTARPANAWYGFPTAAPTLLPAGQTVVAPGPWRRGLLWDGHDTTPPRLWITPGVGFFYAPAERGPVQDVRVAIRGRGDEDDADDTGAPSLEDLDNEINDDDDVSYRWWVTDDGHVGWSGTGAEASDGITWQSVAFRDMLGFDGAETVRTDGAGMYYAIANRPSPLIFMPRRPLIRQVPAADQLGDSLRLADGSHSGTHTGTYPKQILTFWVEGPQDTGTDWHRHWVRFRALTPRGWPITLYQDWGDSRRALGREQTDVDQPAYDILYTSERNGHHGRIVGYVHADTPDPEGEWEGHFRIKHRGSMVLATGRRYA